MTNRIKLLLRAMVLMLVVLTGAVGPAPAAGTIDFNRDVRRILSDNCFKCHGPDPGERKGGKGGLRLDTPEGAQIDLGGYRAIVPGRPAASELVKRILSTDPDEVMPPPESGKKLSRDEIDLLRNWIQQGASYAQHWSYVKPVRPPLPKVRKRSWAKNPIDTFILERLQRERLKPSPQADLATLIRRVALDLTGLPPSWDDVQRVMADRAPEAYERWVDELLARPGFGEHWARLWLDLARYADSTGYADDPARTIWGFRDYVIRSLNANKPFDQFTLEQLAGDLLPDPTEEQLIATAFHRNTLTNNEGGTNDEEYRNVAVIDRVNTTMSVWMGTTMACAQCHSHKYDPITQEDYFRLFAILNQTEDADRGDEKPLLTVYTPEQKRQRSEWETEMARLDKIVRTETPELAAAREQWDQCFPRELTWIPLKPSEVKSKEEAKVELSPEGEVHIARGGKTDVYTVKIFPGTNGAQTLTALRLETLPDEALPAKGPGHAEGNFVISRITATLQPPKATPVSGRYLRIEIPGKDKMVSLAEVQVFRGLENIAPKGEARQSSTDFDGPARLAIDGNTDGRYTEGKSTTHTAISSDPWWELDLKSPQPLDRVVLWNRTDGDLHTRLSDFRVTLLDEKRTAVWSREVSEPPRPSAEFSVSGARAISFSSAYAEHAQENFEAGNVLENKDPKNKGWAISPKFGQAHTLTLVPAKPVNLPPDHALSITIEQLSKFEFATVGRFRLTFSSDARAAEFGRTPANILAILRTSPEKRNQTDRESLARYYLSIAPAMKAEREQLASLRKRYDEMKPYTTVPIFRELAGDKRRKTHLQLRGNFLALGSEVSEGLPAAFRAGAASAEAKPNRLALARWLVDRENPLTARVVVNRLWESIFGIGLVQTSEEFGAQGELPSHPALLDWLAVELVESRWDLKHLLKLMVTSAAYRQSSKVTPELAAKDPDNRLLSRGPRFRLSAEMIRDQALFVSGLLSPKMYGPPVKPPQPKLGLSAAFGSGVDWETSPGEDRHRRALYTTWRRSNPYPSMATFDAPNREVCTVRRERSNTPLQALVTLNDPVYVEAAQGLAQRMIQAASSPAERVRHGFQLCLARGPNEAELREVLALHERTKSHFAGDPADARLLASRIAKDSTPDAEAAELAAWTVVGNVLLNLDEMLMKR